MFPATEVTSSITTGGLWNRVPFQATKKQSEDGKAAEQERPSKTPQRVSTSAQLHLPFLTASNSLCTLWIHQEIKHVRGQSTRDLMGSGDRPDRHTQSCVSLPTQASRNPITSTTKSLPITSPVPPHLMVSENQAKVRSQDCFVS